VVSRLPPFSHRIAFAGPARCDGSAVGDQFVTNGDFPAAAPDVDTDFTWNHDDLTWELGQPRQPEPPYDLGRYRYPTAYGFHTFK